MAYNGANLSQLGAGNLSGTAPQLWTYTSTDAVATVKGAGYISDATGRGMKVRDVVISFDTATPTTYLLTVLSITAGAATLSVTGTQIAE